MSKESVRSARKVKEVGKKLEADASATYEDLVTKAKEVFANPLLIAIVTISDEGSLRAERIGYTSARSPNDVREHIYPIKSNSALAGARFQGYKNDATLGGIYVLDADTYKLDK